MQTINLFQPQVLRFDQAASSAVRVAVREFGEARVDVVSHERQADAVLSKPAAVGRAIDPMLLVHQERVETLRLLARWIKDGFRRLKSRAAGRAHRADVRRPFAANNVDSGAL